MLTSTNPADWYENRAAERIRLRLTHLSPPQIIREQFPLSARYVSLNRDLVYGLKRGTILTYVRTKHIPSAFPFEVLLQLHERDPHGSTTTHAYFKGDELELFVPVDELAFINQL